MKRKKIERLEHKIENLINELDLETAQAPAMIQGYDDWEYYNQQMLMNEQIENKIHQYEKIIREWRRK